MTEQEFNYRYDQGFEIDYVYAHQMIDWLKMTVPNDHQESVMKIVGRLISQEVIVDDSSRKKYKHRYNLRPRHQRQNESTRVEI